MYMVSISVASLARKMVSWEEYAPYCGQSQAEEEEIKHDSQRYVVQKRRMLERWKERSGDSATYRNLVGIFERVEDQTLVNYVYRLLRTTKRLGHTNNRRQKLIFFAFSS